MNAFKCDVCGALYENDAIKKNVRNQITLARRIATGWVDSETTYDLCPECMTAICEVIENRKIGGAQHE